MANEGLKGLPVDNQNSAGYSARGYSDRITKIASNKIFGTKSGIENTSSNGAFSNQQGLSGTKTASAQLVNANSNSASLPVIYGRRRSGGTRVYVESSDGAGDITGTTYLTMVIAISEGPVGWPTKIYFDDEIVWNILTTGTIDTGGGSYDPTAVAGRLKGFEAENTNLAYANIADGEAIITWWRGGYPQVVDPNVQNQVGATRWTNFHRLDGVNYMSVILEANKDYYKGQLPTVTAEFDGHAVYNVAALAVAADKPAYVNDLNNAYYYAVNAPLFGVNPVDVLYNYLTDFIYGKALDYDVDNNVRDPGRDIDLDSFASARTFVNSVYAINGILQTSATMYDNVDSIVNSMNGMLVYIDGKLHLKIRQPNESSVFSFNKNNMLGSFSVQRNGMSTQLNKAQVSFAAYDHDFNDDIWVEINNTYLAEDDFIVLETKIDMPLITDPALIEQLAEYKINASRSQTTISFKAPHTALTIECGDIIDITHTLPGWTAKPFRVLSMSLLSDNTIDIIAQEYISDIQIS